MSSSYFADLQAACVRFRSTADALALVATMGALHAGHTLVRRAIASGAAAVASIFVNPLQFGPTRICRCIREKRRMTWRRWRQQAALWFGCRMAQRCIPPARATVVVGGPAERWEGDARPGHFRGVATVCAKLFGQVRPDRTFGEKDWQQLQVVKRMVSDLLLPLEIVGVETVREADGLAMSSRNRFLTPAERAVAPRLYATLQRTARALVGGAPVAKTLQSAREALGRGGLPWITLRW